MIAAELRRAILIAAGQPGTDPLLRPGPQPGSYISSLPFHLAPQAATDRTTVATREAGARRR